MAARQLAYLFHEVGNLTSEILGGKGFGLAEMNRLGIPVPPGFIIPTGVARAYMQEGRLPKRLEWHLKRAVTLLELKTGKRFGDPTNPLLLSVRSGAPYSMPGMMDTVLNLGINGDTFVGLAEKTQDDEFALDISSRFQHMFQQTVGVEPPDCPWQQLHLSVEAVCKSWQGDRAKAYRATNGIPDKLGTAVVVQVMAFGNAAGLSGTGVVFSRNVATGEPGLYGEWLPQAQGEDLVAGVRTPLPLTKLALVSPKLYGQLTQLMGKLERHFSDVVDVEFTIEQGKLYLLQVRVAKRTPEAAVRIAVDLVAEGLIDQKTAVSRVSDVDLEKLGKRQFDPDAIAADGDNLIATGLPASGGAAVGKAVFCPQKAKELAEAGESVILIRHDTSPDDFEGMVAAKAIITANGGVTCHAAVVARALGKPAVVGIGDLRIIDSLDRPDQQEAWFGDGPVDESQIISVCGTSGRVWYNALPLVGGKTDDKAETFLSWVEEFRPKPKVNLGLRLQHFNMNRLLTDFYLSSALQHATANSMLATKATKLARETSQMVADVLACYVSLAVAGELRHSSGSSSSMTKIPQAYLRLYEFGVEPGKYDRYHTQKAFVEKLEESKRFIDFLKVAVEVFRNGDWSSGYGGEKWAKIAECLLQYLDGTINRNLFVDRMFDLRHNGGRLFDKHGMVSDNTDESFISSQLDVKREHTGGILELERALRDYAKPSEPVAALLQEWKELEDK